MTTFRIVAVSEIFAFDVILGWSMDGGRTFALSEPIAVTARTDSKIFGSRAGMPYTMMICDDMLIMERIDES